MKRQVLPHRHLHEIGTNLRLIRHLARLNAFFRLPEHRDLASVTVLPDVPPAQVAGFRDAQSGAVNQTKQKLVAFLGVRRQEPDQPPPRQQSFPPDAARRPVTRARQRAGKYRVLQQDENKLFMATSVRTGASLSVISGSSKSWRSPSPMSFSGLPKWIQAIPCRVSGRRIREVEWESLEVGTLKGFWCRLALF